MRMMRPFFGSLFLHYPSYLFVSSFFALHAAWGASSFFDSLLCVLLALPGLRQPFGQRGVLGAMYRPATFFSARL